MQAKEAEGEKRDPKEMAETPSRSENSSGITATIPSDISEEERRPSVKKESEIDLAVGLVLRKKVGDYVEAGESIVTVHANTEDISAVVEKIYAHIHMSNEAVEAPKPTFALGIVKTGFLRVSPMLWCRSSNLLA